MSQHTMTPEERAAAYRELDNPTNPRVIAIAQAVVQAIRNATTLDKEKTSVLDFACGSGHFARQFHSHVASLSGVDINEAAVAKYNALAAELGVADHMHAITADIVDGDSNPLAGKTFDAVVCSAAFHHFKDPAKVTKLLASFLRPGGALLVVDVSRDSPEGGLAPKDYKFGDTPGTAVHHEGFSGGEIKTMFEAAGLTNVEFANAGTLEVIPGTWTTMFLAKGIKP